MHNVRLKHNLFFWFTAGPQLKVVSTMSAGFDHIKLPVLAERSIRLGVSKSVNTCNRNITNIIDDNNNKNFVQPSTAPDALTDAVAEITVMLALMALRRGKEALSTVHTGQVNHNYKTCSLANISKH